MSRTQRSLRMGRPIWLRDAPRVSRTYPSLSGHHETSVAVVGGGLIGALVAQAFASSGIATVVLEAATVGRGSTAASSALLLQETDLDLIQLIERYGSRAGRRVWQLGQDSVRELVALLKRLRVRCDLTTGDAIYYARDRESAERLRREFDVRRQAGLEADWLTAGELRNTTGIAGPAAIRTRGNAQLDPYRACVGVLRSAVAAGAQVFERSKVRHIDASRDRVRLRTGGGILDARRVVIATEIGRASWRERV